MNLETNFDTTVVKKESAFKARNYKNSPTVREFYRFIAKNNLRDEAYKLLREVLMGKDKKNSYLLKLDI